MDLYALELLEAGDLFEVLDHDHPEFAFYVSFDDEIAHEHDDALERLVDDVAELPGVVRAVREDREVVLIGGSVDAPALEEWLAGWWRAELRDEPLSEPGEPGEPGGSGESGMPGSPVPRRRRGFRSWLRRSA